ncbi:hypothetical protein [Caudoviricetes sp.]|nr:hypothetical protein [Caudoviricetes sp.]
MADFGEQRRQQFNDSFNELLGDKIGKTRKNYSSKQFDNQISLQMAQYAAGIGGKKAPKIANPKGKKSSLGFAISDETKESQIDSLASSAEGVKIPAVDKGLWDSVKSTPGKLFGAIPKQISSPLLTGLEYLSRPGNTLTNAVYQGAKALKEGEPFYSVLDDVGYGAKQGLLGKDHYGIGDVEEMADTGHDTPMWLKRAIGFAGDVAFDPTTYFSFGATTLLKEGSESGLKQGLKETLKQGVKASTKETGKAAVETVIKKSIKASVADATIANVDDIVADVINKTDKVIYEVKGGAQRGKLVGGKESYGTIAKQAGESYRDAMLKATDVKIKKFVDSLKNGKPLKKAELDALKADPAFAAFHSSYMRNFKKPFGSDAAETMARRNAAKALDSDASEIANKIIGELQRDLARVPTLRFNYGLLNYEKALPRLGAVGEAGRTFANKHGYSNFQKAFSYSSHLPGYSTLLAQKVRSGLSDNFKEFRKRMITLSDGISKEHKRLLHTLTEEGIDISTQVDGELGKQLQAVQDAIRGEYETMWLQELQAGVRGGSKAARDPNYVYTHVKGVVKEGTNKKEWLKQRELAFKSTGSHKGFLSSDALKAGVKVEQDVFDNLLQRKAKQARKLTRHNFKVDLVSHYGVTTSASKAELARRGMTVVPEHQLPTGLKLKPGEKVALDSDIQKIYNEFSEMMRVGEADDILKPIDAMTRYFKVANTIPYPSFHVRNMIGDVFMGAMDGVKTKDYMRVLAGWKNRATSKLTIGGEKRAYRDIVSDYEKNVSSGAFFDAEITNLSKHELDGKGFVAGLTTPTSYPSTLRKLSEKREDFARFVHFVHALDEEMTHNLKKYASSETAYDQAINAAIFRVNKYKFDYGALTKFEKSVMKRGMPFYTYVRKAAPTMAEALYMSPRYIGATQSFLDNYAPEGPGNFRLPSFLEEGGFGQITGGDEPYGITTSVLPTNVLRDVTSNPVNKLSPGIRAPFELNSGKTTFSNKPINGLPDLLMSNVKVFGLIDNLARDDKGLNEKLFNFFGVPVTKVSQKMQDSEFQSLKFDFKEKVTKLDDYATQKGYKVYLSERKDGVTLRVKAIDSKEVLAEFSSFREAAAFISSM